MGRGHGHHHHPGQHLRFHPGQPHLQHHRYHQVQHLPPHPGQMPPWQDGFIARMGEILRLREQNRANLRVVRQREQQAMRELQRANNLVPAPAHAAAAFGIPQAVPEPAPFLDLVEAQGRNIQVVQRGAAHFFPAQQHLVAPRHMVGLPPRDPAMQVQIRAAQEVGARHRHERQAALVEEDQRRERDRQRHERRAAMAEEDQHREREAEARRRQERRQRHEMIREQLEVTRRRARQTEEALTAEQRERSARSREEAVARLRRNREEVQRRQRRAEEGAARLRRQRGEPAAAAQEQPHQQANQVPARQFNFQEILDLDALNPEYLGM